jgi:F-type H+-transporting ATPase subunit delta
MSSLLAKRYAEAFFSLGMESNCLDALYDDMVVMKDVLGEDNVLKVLTNPNILQSEKYRMLRDSVEGKVQPITLGLFELIFVKSRDTVMLDIIGEFIEKVRQHRGITTAKVTTIAGLSQAQCDKLSQVLGKYLNKTVEIIQHKDPEILGGVRIIADGKIFDSSVSTKLQEMSRLMSM